MARRRRPARVRGALAALVALAAGELAGFVDRGAPSLLISMGQAVIDRAPPVAEDAAIDLLGTADKPALVVLMAVVTLLLGAAVGDVARRRFAVAVGAYVVGGVVLTWPALTRAGTAAGAVVLAGLATVGAGLGTLWLLVRAPAPAPARDGAGETPPDGPAGRRQALRLLGHVAVVAVAAGGTGRFLARYTRSGIPDVVLPSPGAGLDQPAVATSFPGIDGLASLFTPNDRFFRIDTALVLPRVDLDAWRLRVSGLVERPFELTYDELLALAQSETDITLSCVSNEVGGNLVGTARWQGVPLTDLLERAGVRPEASQVVGRSVDGWTGGFPTALAYDGRPAIVAVGMNGEPLPLAHGFPARLVIAGLYGYVSATKWLTEIELTTLDAFDGYWVPRGWNKLGPVEIQSRIDVPRYGARLEAGPQTVAGVAWAPPVGVEAVEVSVDGGPWERAQLSAELSPHVWRQWRHTWDAPPGRHEITVRAVDHDGRVQTEERRRPRPGGATGLHTVAVRTT